MRLLKRTTINPRKNILKQWWGLKRIKFAFLGGRNIRIMPSCFFGHSDNIYVENNVYIGPHAYFDAISTINIKEGVMIGPNCTMIAGNHNYKSNDLKSVPYDNRMIDTPIVIEKNVWIGANVTICPGTHIEEGAIIGAGCSVHGIVPKFAVVVPSEFKIIGYRNKKLYESLAKQNKVYNLIYAGKEFEMISKDKIMEEVKDDEAY